MSISAEKVARMRADILSRKLSVGHLARVKFAVTDTAETIADEVLCFCGAGALANAVGTPVHTLQHGVGHSYDHAARMLVEKTADGMRWRYGVRITETGWYAAMRRFDTVGSDVGDPGLGYVGGRAMTDLEAVKAVDAFLDVIAELAEDAS